MRAILLTCCALIQASVVDAQAVRVPPVMQPLNKAAVDKFVNLITNGSGKDIKMAVNSDVQVGIVHRNPSTRAEVVELSSKGSDVLVSQLHMLKKKINSPSSYSCSYEQYFASCRSKIAKGKGAAIISLATDQRGVSFVRISYATFDEMYKAYVGK
ncbi:MAG: hypothetical protein ACO1NM_12585 [Sphingobium phenoxybenzoativorans]|uniref:hypothetical protein n=1 Tax=Sphingobium phenoxybenzoativorans TaxID=1592790 RepID=UPI001112DEAF|nr:hypothetical protein [Sphingobium phenoxybenzoativorans]